jgi:hypothetical protein
MDFNSLGAQREACEAYVASQKGQGWVLFPDRYDDGGVSEAKAAGVYRGRLRRPSISRL